MSDARAPSELRAVAAVYAELVRLRRAPEASAADAALRALAAELPGALRILDQMPLELLAARAADLAAAAAEPERAGHGEPIAHPPWIAATLAWRRTMRHALAVRRAAGRARSPAAAARADGGRLGGDLEAVVRPPEGRLVPWALSRLAAELGRAPAALEREIFGPVKVSALGRLARR